MKNFNNALFWGEKGLTSFELEGHNFLLVDEVNCVLEGFRLKLSDEIYDCENCRMFLGSIKSASYNRPGDSVSIDMFIPVNFIFKYLTNNY